jgi:hypothetical protein|tara:strand:- start:19 stop:285 length:267 start_codon:yes stop_codon:yes gene_type:complete
MSQGKYDLEYWNKIQSLRNLNLKVDSVIKEDKRKQEDTRKVVKMLLISINNKDMLEGGLVLYNKSTILRFGMNIFFKYFVSTFNKYCK